MYHTGTLLATKIGTALVLSQNEKENGDDAFVDESAAEPELDEIIKAFFLDQYRRKQVRLSRLAEQMKTSRSHLDRMLGKAAGEKGRWGARHLSALARAKGVPLHAILEQLAGFARSYEDKSGAVTLPQEKDEAKIASGARPVSSPEPKKGVQDETIAPSPKKDEGPSRKRGR